MTPYQKYKRLVGDVITQEDFAKLQHHMANFNENDRFVMLYNLLNLMASQLAANKGDKNK